MKLILYIVSIILFASNTLAGEELTTNEKEAIVKSVYKKVFAASTNDGIAPNLLFVNEKSNMASMGKDDQGKPLLKFEESAFDVCAAFGDKRDDAIAFLIGHEIAHHNLEHNWSDDFRFAYTVKDLRKEFVKHDRDTVSRKKFETQADERGGIYAYMAGYNSSGIISDLLTNLYTEYGFVDNPKYPSLQQRINLAEEQDSLVQVFIKVFENANYAMLAGKYNIAIHCYEYIVQNQKFESREILNNLGVAYFQKGVELTDAADIKYIYPIELDLESKLLDRGHKGMGPDLIELFEKAKNYFELAARRDKEFATGYLNIACAQSVLGEYDMAYAFLKKAMKYSKDSKTATFKNAQVVMAIINDLNPDGDKEETKDILESLVDEGHILADLNLQIFNGKDIVDLDPIRLPISWMGDDVEASENSMFTAQEKISGLSEYSQSALTKIPAERSEVIKTARRTKVYVGSFDDSRVFASNDENNKFLLFHSTLDNYIGETEKGIMLGSSKADVLKLYGTPNSVINTAQGDVYSYNSSQLLILINTEGIVTKWIIWRSI